MLVSHQMNRPLMLIWLWRIRRDEGGLWLHLIKPKYLQDRLLLACECRKGSQLWKSIQSIKHESSWGHRLHRQWRWHPFLAGPVAWQYPLCAEFSDIFATCSDPMLLVAPAAKMGIEQLVPTNIWPRRNCCLGCPSGDSPTGVVSGLFSVVS